MLVYHLFHLAITCDDLPDIPNGSVFQSGSSLGSVTTYSCDPGYELDFDVPRICLDTGEWSGSEPTCRRKILLIQKCMVQSLFEFAAISYRV